MHLKGLVLTDLGQVPQHQTDLGLAVRVLEGLALKHPKDQGHRYQTDQVHKHLGGLKDRIGLDQEVQDPEDQVLQALTDLDREVLHLKKPDLGREVLHLKNPDLGLEVENHRNQDQGIYQLITFEIPININFSFEYQYLIYYVIF